MGFIFGGEEQGQILALVCQPIEGIEIFGRRFSGKFFQISLAEPDPCLGMGMKPFAESIGRRQILEPGMDTCRFLLQPARPQPVDQYSSAISAVRFLVDALDRDGHDLSYYCTFATEDQREAKFLTITEFIDRILTTKVFCLCMAAMAIVLASCTSELHKSDAELGLNPKQAAGRRVYDNYCARCHEPYSSRDKQGPSLQGVFKHQYLAVSGLPANDERVAEIIRYGRGKMQGFSQALTQQQADDLLAYLKTL